jgi:hypothetical protein
MEARERCIVPQRSERKDAQARAGREVPAVKHVVFRRLPDKRLIAPTAFLAIATVEGRMSSR